jgi:hypothetical protein
MASPNSASDLTAAWRALAGSAGSDGWQTIPLGTGGPCRILAARMLPGNEEAVLIGFRHVHLPPDDQLPQGKGFLVTGAHHLVQEAGRVWVSLSRQSAGSVDLFTMMASDVFGTMDSCSGVADERVFHIFITRIRAWQEFMRREGDGLLGPEDEIGLIGELLFLCDVLVAGARPVMAAEAWQGPLDGLHDFAFGRGAVEVKTSAASSGFPAVISSLEQLDDTPGRVLFLAAIRLAPDPSGQTLAETVEDVRRLMRTVPAAGSLLDSRLLHAGFLDAVSDRYVRRFSRVRTRIMAITAGFPRLARTSVRMEIRRARYELDIDAVTVADIPLGRLLEQLGAI